MNRADLVAEAMQRAKQEAELLKARKRLEKLQAAGHDISHLKAAYEGRSRYCNVQAFQEFVLSMKFF